MRSARASALPRRRMPLALEMERLAGGDPRTCIAGLSRPTTHAGRSAAIRSSLRNVYRERRLRIPRTTCSKSPGGRNVFGDVTRQSVQASTEMMLTRRPDVHHRARSTATASRPSTSRASCAGLERARVGAGREEPPRDHARRRRVRRARPSWWSSTRKLAARLTRMLQMNHEPIR